LATPEFNQIDPTTQKARQSATSTNSCGEPGNYSNAGGSAQLLSNADYLYISPVVLVGLSSEVSQTPPAERVA